MSTISLAILLLLACICSASFIPEVSHSQAYDSFFTNDGYPHDAANVDTPPLAHLWKAPVSVWGRPIKSHTPNSVIEAQFRRKARLLLLPSSFIRGRRMPKVARRPDVRLG